MYGWETAVPPFPNSNNGAVMQVHADQISPKMYLNGAGMSFSVNTFRAVRGAAVSEEKHISCFNLKLKTSV